MAALSELARNWLRKTELGKGIRIDADALDLLNAIGVGEFIQAAAAEQQRKICENRINPSIRGDGINSSTTGSGTEAFGHPISRSSGMIRPQDVTEAAQRAQRALKMRSIS